jgi:hypothetical protein
MDEIQMKKTQVEIRFEQLKAPLLDRQRQLEKKKEAFQVNSHPVFILLVLQFCFQFVVFGAVAVCSLGFGYQHCRGKCRVEGRATQCHSQNTLVCVCCFVSQKSVGFFDFNVVFALSNVNFIHLTFIVL